MQKAVTTAFDGNPGLLAKGEGMSNGSRLSLSMATSGLYHRFIGLHRTLCKCPKRFDA